MIGAYNLASPFIRLHVWNNSIDFLQDSYLALDRSWYLLYHPERREESLVPHNPPKHKQK